MEVDRVVVEGTQVRQTDADPLRAKERMAGVS